MIAAVAYGKRLRYLSSPFALLVAAASVYAWSVLSYQWTGGFYGAASTSSASWIVSPTIEAATWALFALAYLEQSWKMPATADRSLAALGAISFSIYIWHFPVLVMANKLPVLFVFSEWYLNFALIIFPAILAISALSYFIVEKPFFALRTRYIVDDGFTHAPSYANTNNTADTSDKDRKVSTLAS
jgi:peptidoglycan/LPS O-acetylase OafA/YrhL